MNLIQMQNYLVLQFKKNSYIYNNANNIPNHTLRIRNAPVVLNANITISYPGTKKGYDYLVLLNTNWAVSHEDIMNEIVQAINKHNVPFSAIENLLIDISYNWENVNIMNYQNITFDRMTLSEFIETICYISTQEEMNYPREKNYDGYKRPFYSYLEALYSTTKVLTLTKAIIRCKTNSRFSFDYPSIPYKNI